MKEGRTKDFYEKRTANPLSDAAFEFMKKIFECEAPCDSWGVCRDCIEESCFLAGYDLGYKAALAKGGVNGQTKD